LRPILRICDNIMSKSNRVYRNKENTENLSENFRYYRSIRESTIGKKMQPYCGKKGKIPVTPSKSHALSGGGFKLGVSKLGKTVAKNANRARKKVVRRNIKNELKYYQNNYEY